MRPLGDHTPAPSAAPLSVTGCRALLGEPEKGRLLPQPSHHAHSSQGCRSPEMVPESGTRGAQGPWGGVLWQRLPGGGLTRTSEKRVGCGEAEEEGRSWLEHRRGRSLEADGRRGSDKRKAGPRGPPCGAGVPLAQLPWVTQGRLLTGFPVGPLCHPHSEPSRAATPVSGPAVAPDGPGPTPRAPRWAGGQGGYCFVTP